MSSFALVSAAIVAVVAPPIRLASLVAALVLVLATIAAVVTIVLVACHLVPRALLPDLRCR